MGKGTLGELLGCENKHERYGRIKNIHFAGLRASMDWITDQASKCDNS